MTQQSKRAAGPVRGKRDANKREDLIRIGVAVFTEKGFHNTPIDELVAAVGVPKGSFAYYFGSKDAYTLAVIERYAEYFNKKLDRILSDGTLEPIDRIKAFMDEATEGMERFEFRRGCLVGNLGQELAALDETFRQALLATVRGWQCRIQLCLEQAQQSGSLSEKADVEGLGRLFWYAWEGAVLGAKLEKSRAPLDSVSEAFIGQLRALGPKKSEQGGSAPSHGARVSRRRASASSA
ncbi:TetR/AcrR family transcriptional regulator [Burkholderia cenocepacia]|uniref:TetR/AcrR family transcriptional regulator n=1 Tax=Burkholderia cenocepacia TaxID=95486 RepID=A0ABD4UL84_9BURK|nr:TetR/AcrR family transcriptional regulator [Burkholderia cenocepacia]MCW3698908.1 TetR/AcrR family transcriptional regulator [Burkholderia cenocepacia]MCW3706526.1 TetR/AcrR family transcriptional regulator [Burkholderia cenocepacia]MCW3714983.1 TetR/AcrR family transcriptional regulator [Burkholderia cenocepacia]MCW3722701.1 TetR/AcrR family transcriptional regulator [Burkholderia cenocepacia]MCW3729755.1 TetR/AcrR family transcriptional regulator [Burkholderia cenocepacia]